MNKMRYYYLMDGLDENLPIYGFGLSVSFAWHSFILCKG